jgi:hypothetical protein
VKNPAGGRGAAARPAGRNSVGRLPQAGARREISPPGTNKPGTGACSGMKSGGRLVSMRAPGRSGTGGISVVAGHDIQAAPPTTCAMALIVKCRFRRGRCTDLICRTISCAARMMRGGQQATIIYPIYKNYILYWSRAAESKAARAFIPRQTHESSNCPNNSPRFIGSLD